MYLLRRKLLDLYRSRLNLMCTSVPEECERTLRNIDKVIPRNALDQFDNNSLQKENGIVYDIKPFKLKLQKDKRYAWCLCGHSKSQPLCDCTHKIAELNIKLKPIFFKVEETKEYWLCNCKQTTHRPFCDGSHLELQRQKRLSDAEKAAKRAAREKK